MTTYPPGHPDTPPPVDQRDYLDREYWRLRSTAIEVERDEWQARALQAEESSESLQASLEYWVGRARSIEAAAFRRGAEAARLDAKLLLNGKEMTMGVGPGAGRRDEWYVLGWADARTKALSLLLSMPLPEPPEQTGTPFREGE